MVSNSISDTELLQFAIKSGMLDAALVEEKIEMQKRKALLEKHPYSIWPGKDGKWYTYLPDEEKKRKKALKKRKTKEEIEKLVIDYWEERIEKERIYLFSDAYFMWREVQDQLVDDNTVAKYETDYNRFFKDSEFLVMDIKKINDDTIRIFMFNTIKKCRLQKEPMRKLFGYIKNSILFARKNGILESNPIEFLESKDFSRYCYEVYKPESKKNISREDMKDLQKRFEKDHEKKPNYIPTYAVEFASLTGMRVSEISALRWDCITDEYIVIDKSEKSNRSKNEFRIEMTKNHKIRFFPMTSEIKKLLEKIRKVETESGYLCEWVFANEEGRVHAKTISSCSKTKCRQLKIDEKGIHAYRKTLNSRMRCNGVSATVAASMLGHTTEVNERYYTFDMTNMDEKARIVSKVNQETCVV